MNLNGLYDYLAHWHMGREHAIKMRELAQRLHVPERQMQGWIRDLAIIERRPVCTACSNPMGVYVAATRRELQDYITQLRARARETWLHAEALSRIELPEHSAQETFAFRAVRPVRPV